MTRNHLVATFFALTAITVAQAWPGPAVAQTKVTMAGGLNLASVAVSVDEDVDPESVARLAIGVSAGIPVSEGLGLHLGAAYSQKGFGFSDFGAEATTGIDYLEFTALAGIPFAVGERASMHLLAGPALALKVSCGVSASFEGLTASEDCGDGGPKSMDLGLTAGGRLEIGLSGNTGLSFGALYNLGLTNMDDSGGDDTIKNRVLTLQAGVVFTIG